LLFVSRLIFIERIFQMDIVLRVHSIARWVVILVSILAIVWFALVLIRRQGSSADRRVMLAFTIAMDIQTLIGIILIIGLAIAGGGVPGFRIEHGVTMLAATMVGHISARWKNADETTRARNNLIVIVAVLALVFIGVARLPGGWMR
jgi:hypothetical protein